MASDRELRRKDEDWKESIKSIKKNTEETVARLDTIESKLCTYVDVSKFSDLSDRVNALESTVSLLCAKLERNDIQIGRLTREQTELKAHSMKSNIIFTFDPTTQNGKEIPGENCISVVKTFMATVMNVPNANSLYISVAHRLGSRIHGYTRAILAKFPIAAELQTVLKHSNRLRNTRHFT